MILETINDLSSSANNANSQSSQQIQLLDSPQQKTHKLTSDEIEFLQELQERLLVLFQGLSMPQNQFSQAKLDLTINFLEYQLSVIQERLDSISK